MLAGVEWSLCIVAAAAAAAAGRRGLLHMILMAEAAWVGLYLAVVQWGLLADSVLLAVWAIFFMCIASAESAVGLSLLLFRFAVYGTLPAIGGAEQRRRGLAPLQHLND